jgi:hypothetical protein
VRGKKCGEPRPRQNRKARYSNILEASWAICINWVYGSDEAGVN